MSKLEQISREAKMITEKQCPYYVDQFTRADSMTFDPATLCFYYNYTVRDTLDNESLYTAAACENFRQQTIQEIRSSIRLKEYKEAGLTLVWRYYSEKCGRLIKEFRFTKEDYR